MAPTEWSRLPLSILLTFVLRSNFGVQASLSNDSNVIGKALQSLEQPYYPHNADCVNYMVPIDISYDNFE